MDKNKKKSIRNQQIHVLFTNLAFINSQIAFFFLVLVDDKEHEKNDITFLFQTQLWQLNRRVAFVASLNPTPYGTS